MSTEPSYHATAPRRSGPRHLAEGDDPASESALRIVWLCPDLLSTYGDRGNMLILARRAYVRGIPVETIEVRSDEPVPQQGDIYLLGGGEDGPQALAAQRLNANQGLHRALARGATALVVCAGYQLIGTVFGGDEAGRAYAASYDAMARDLAPAVRQLFGAMANVSATVHQGLNSIVDADDPRAIA